MTTAPPRGTQDRLAEPFHPKDIKFKPQLVKGDKALAIGYMDVRAVQDRLDDVLGVENWQDDYDIAADGSVVCRLKVNLGGGWVTKTDVGSPSEQPDGGDRLKAAFSDALKRTAVKFGIGRYLYRLPAQWVDYDPVRKQIVRPPQLPAFAQPPAKPAPATPEPTPKPAARSEPTAANGQTPKPNGPPADGHELHRRLQDHDARLAAQKVCPRGALLARVTAAGVKAGYSPTMTEWGGPAITLAIEVVREFEKELAAKRGQG